MPRALLTGITGQLGSYLAELLLSKGYTVHGIIRRSSSFNTGRIDHIFDKLHLHYGDLSDGTGLRRIINESMPDEVFHLGAMSHVRVSFDQPEYTSDVIATGTLRLLEAIRDCNVNIKLLNSSTSEMFGSSPPPQSEKTPFRPRSPYACAKLAAHSYCVNYRESYGMHILNALTFNSESPRRGETFVTRKITRAATRIKLGLQDKLVLGNLSATRDWTFAGDTVSAMHSMLQLEGPADLVIASGQAYSIRDFLYAAFRRVGLHWPDFVETNDKYLRPAEVPALCGDSHLARELLGWKPTVSFDGLVDMMVDADLRLAQQEKLLRYGKV
jgi:GDPmannose 4,6-dehydratase